jgi:hypothetical protein
MAVQTPGTAGAPWGGVIGRYGGMQPGSPQHRALQWAFNQQQQAAQQGQDRLSPGQFTGGQFGGVLQQMLTNPQGMSPAVLEQLQSRIAAMGAGGVKDAQRQFAEQAQAGGMGDSVAAARGSADIAARGGQDVMGQILDLLVANEQMRMQQQQAAIPAMGQLSSLEAMMNQLAAQGYFQRQFPAIPGISGAEQGQQWQFIDPQTGGVKGTPPGGWNEQNFAAMQDERRRWLAQQGQAA